ncbi:MAG: hypothetical protein B7Z37_12050 [Verrucomicrobia bacterium 12-59-8]|nr:MAG: hypothetical protein B7Z37_12050 [Verrucomicrobia bacterium 12-59-8]
MLFFEKKIKQRQSGEKYELLSMGESTEVNTDDGKLDQGLVMTWIAFMIAVEPAAFHQPSEGIFLHTELGQQDKVHGLFAAFDDLQPLPWMAEYTAHHLGPVAVLHAAGVTVERGGYSLGSIRRWQPILSTYLSA